MEEALTAFLLAQPAVTALVGDRINWGQRPQASALPAIVLEQISAPRSYSFRGRDRLIGYLVQLECWANSYGAAKTLARAVAGSLDRDWPAGGLRFVEIEDERSDSDAGPTTTLYRTSLDLRAWVIA